MEEKSVQVGPVKTSCWFGGQDSHRPPLFLIHGLGGFIEVWKANIGALSLHRRLVIPDLVGFGQSDKPQAPYDFAYFTRFLKGLMDSLGIAKADFVSHSLGGGATLKLAFEFPKRVGRVVLVSSAGLGRKVHLLLRLCTLPMIGELLSRPSRHNIARMLYESVYRPEVITDSMIETALRMAQLPQTQRAFLKTVRALGNIGGLRRETVKNIVSRLGEVRCPVLILWGRQDRILPVRHALIAHKHIPVTQIRIFDRCGHNPQLEHPDEFHRLVLEFLGS